MALAVLSAPSPDGPSPQQPAQAAGQSPPPPANPAVALLQAALQDGSLALLLGQLSGGGIAAALAGAAAGGPAAPPPAGGPAAPPSDAARTQRRNELYAVVQAAVVGALAPPPSPPSAGAGSSPYRPLEEERTLARSMAAGFALDDAPPLLPTGGDRASLRIALIDTILQACVALHVRDDAMSLLPSYLQACAHVASDASRTHCPCPWNVFVDNSVVGPAAPGATLEQALLTFRRAGVLGLSHAAPARTSGPSITLELASTASPTAPLALSSDSSRRDASESLLGDPGREHAKDVRLYLAKLRKNPLWLTGAGLVSGGTTLGAELASAASDISRDSMTGATSIDLHQILFPGQTPSGSIPYEALRLSSAVMQPPGVHATTIRRALADCDVLTSAHHSILACALAHLIVEKKLNIGIGHHSNGGAVTFFADSTRTSDNPSSIASFPAWWRDTVMRAVKDVIFLMAHHDRPASMQIVPRAQFPCVELSEEIGAGLFATLQDLAEIFTTAPIQWLVGLLLCMLFIEGNAHCRMHAALESAVRPMTIAFEEARSRAQWPHWLNYRSDRCRVIPPGWPFVDFAAGGGALLSPTPAPRQPVPVVRETTAHSPSHPGGGGRRGGLALGGDRRRPRAVGPAATSPLPVPWAVANPTEKRGATTCIFCGPPTEHMLIACTAYNDYLARGGRMLPALRRFPVGTSLSEVK